MDSNKSQATPIIEITDLTKTYVMGATEVQALRSVSLTVREGEYVAIIGASGSGKSTLMNMIGLLDRPTSGSYRIRGTEASRLGKNRLADLRCREIGFVFQRFNLLARATAQRQVELPLFYAGIPSRKAAQMAVDALTRVGLGERTHHRPEELSGGQQQRVAIARALVNKPGLLLADEPTGALDSKTGQEILALFDELHHQGITLVVVTHDVGVAHRAERIITLRDGEIIEDRQNVPTRPHDTTPLHANGTVPIYAESESLLSEDVAFPVNGNGHSTINGDSLSSVNGDSETIDQLVARAIQRHMAEQAEATHEAV